ncbi:hypothetical protein [Achromobacter insolitus]|uniref:hypothetical protein n=1 Tax=Achromobacter insolitus TaxID=217204 RepID=UPI00366D1DA4
MTKFAVLIALTFVLTGCTKDEETPWARLEAASTAPSVATNSPDATVKSWWHVLDTESELAYTTCKETRSLYRPADSARKKLLTEAVLKERSSDEVCSKQTYRREITNVDIQSDTRALVFASVQNSVPPTPGYVMDENDKRRKEKGLRLRYLLERSDREQPWKIAQLYADESYCSLSKVDGWCPIYSDNRGTANSFVFAATQ